GLASATYGNVDHGAHLRYGGAAGETAYRVYGLGSWRGHAAPPPGRAGDDWNGRQAGFRADWQGEGDAVTVQGDVFENRMTAGVISGGNLLARWHRALEHGQALEVQAYYDRVERDILLVLDSLETFDVEAHHV